MNTKKKSSPESIVREIKRKSRRKYSAEEKGSIQVFTTNGARPSLRRANSVCQAIQSGWKW
jgi:hypothetical protein